MSGGADLFRVLSHAENVEALVADTRPSLVVDRTGGRLLWANAAGAAFFGVATVDKLTALRFSAASPFARRIAALDDTLVSGQDRIERLPLQRGMLPRPTVCKASRVVADGVKAILLTIVDGTGSLAGDPAAAFAALAATALPEAAPAEDIEAVSEDVAPDSAKGADETGPAAAVPEEIAAESVAESDEADAETLETVEVVDTALEETTPDNVETTDEEASAEPTANAQADVEDVMFEDAEVAAEDASPEPLEDVEAVPEQALPETIDATTTLVEDAPPEPVADAGDVASEDAEVASEEASPEPEEDVEAIAEDVLPETVEVAVAPVEDASSGPAGDIEASAGDTPSEPVEAPQAVAAPAFVFPAHGRAVRFVFELDPQLVFTFVSADLAETVGPGMADVAGRTWTEVAGRLEFDPAGRIAEALGRRDTFTGLTVDWPVEGESLRVPADLAGMPVFGRERSFRGYRGFGVLKTGAAFEAPVPAEPIVLSEPEVPIPLPAIGEREPEDVVDEPAEPAPAAEIEAIDAGQAPVAAPDSIDEPPAADEAAPEEPVAAVTEAASTEADDEQPDAAAETPEELGPADVAEDAAPDISEAGEPDPSAETASEHIDSLDEVLPEDADIEVADEPAEVVPEDAPSEPIVAAEEPAPEETEPVADEPAEAASKEDLPAPVDSAGDEPVVAGEEPVEADELSEPLPLVTPPPTDEAADAADAEPPAPSVTEVVSSAAPAHRTTFASLTGDKARALSKPERDAFDKIAEALADAFGPRILAEPVDRTALPPLPVVGRKAEAPADIGPSIDIALLDKLPVALAILRGGDIIHANRAFLDLCGYPDVAAIDADGGFAQVFEGAALNRDAAIPAIRRRDGVELPVSARLHSMPMEGGIASLLVVQETAAATSRDRLATAEQRAEDMEAILDTATDGVLVLDQKGLVIGANKSAEALFGNERSHMIGMAFVDLLAPESHRSALDYLDGLSRNALSSVLNDGREVIGRVAGGGLVPLFMTVGRVSATKFCAVLRDITQWKRAEEELTSAKKAAENASSQKSDFLAKMSHEIRTPLNAIIGFSEVMMEERFGPVGNDRYKEYLRDIHVSGTHIMSLVNDLLDLSKIEAGKLELTFEAVGLNDVVRECAALMQPQANRERIIIRTSLSSSLPPVVADNRSLRQIILNLLSNAVKFNSAGGQVIVSTLYEESGEVVLRVRDTGQGMSEGDIVKAMEPFRQLSTSRTGGGTGLGLPLTKALVEANRASFQIDSTPGQGTMIQITFPSTRVLAE
ncbi:PAS domain protein [uncultured Pleomorphomonas sp.]|uniref:histidine kinase n=1 Tax=uncultured Pleomorphomonas sp. TaxID=442121 RepID=A0A212LHJ6_9HYPH|nr:ATP-binding protein [uncultured Pleomorphomonas sp.]SCM77026.1 PAS domain protein [uncultured Pleomorphomonas sp.]